MRYSRSHLIARVFEDPDFRMHVIESVNNISQDVADVPETESIKHERHARLRRHTKHKGWTIS
jgi:hypothetical protein